MTTMTRRPLTAVDHERHHREADRMVHELVGAVTYWACEAEDATAAKRLGAIRGLVERYVERAAEHYAELGDDPS